MPVVVLTAKELTDDERAFLAERTLLVLSKSAQPISQLGAALSVIARQRIARAATARSAGDRAGIAVMPKILLVEDNEMNRDMLSRRLARNGFEVVIAVDGQQGVDMATSESPTSS